MNEVVSPEDPTRILSDIRAYVRISAASASKATAQKTLDTWEKALVYSKLNGVTSQAKIAEDTTLPQKTVSNWVIEFVESGLASEPNELFKSHRALFSLRELGIDLAKLKPRKKPKNASQIQGTIDAQPPSSLPPKEDPD